MQKLKSLCKINKSSITTFLSNNKLKLCNEIFSSSLPALSKNVKSGEEGIKISNKSPKDQAQKIFS
jgi:hypothetical protein